MTFLVIGSNSFSGSNFVNHLLKNKFNVVGVSRSKELDERFLPYTWKKSKFDEDVFEKFSFRQIDLNKDQKELFDLIEEKKPSYIVNFAAQGMVAESWLNPHHWYKTNLLSQVTFHDYLRKCKFLKRYIHITTPEVYGSTDQGWIKESFNFAPSTPYAVSRAACDLHL